MAKAYECDRCKKLYTRIDSDEYDDGITSDPELRLVRTSTKRNAYYNVLDLCPECTSELNKWFEGKI